jgi:mannitol/fructose-specific phosphotransferase system IIA component
MSTGLSRPTQGLCFGQDGVDFGGHVCTSILAALAGRRSEHIGLIQ